MPFEEHTAINRMTETQQCRFPSEFASASPPSENSENNCGKQRSSCSDIRHKDCDEILKRPNLPCSLNPTENINKSSNLVYDHPEADKRQKVDYSSTSIGTVSKYNEKPERANSLNDQNPKNSHHIFNKPDTKKPDIKKKSPKISWQQKADSVEPANTVDKMSATKSKVGPSHQSGAKDTKNQECKNQECKNQDVSLKAMWTSEVICESLAQDKLSRRQNNKVNKNNDHDSNWTSTPKTSKTQRLSKPSKRSSPKPSEELEANPVSTTITEMVDRDFEILWTKHCAANKNRLIYIVPDNPGGVRPYLCLATLLCGRFGADVCVASHLGHCNFTRKVYDLKSQLTHHRTLVRKYSKKYSSYILLGHGIGGYLSLCMADSSSDIIGTMRCLLLVTPYMSRFPRILHVFLRILSSKLVSRIISILVKYMPLKIIKFIVSTASFVKLRSFDIFQGLFLDNYMSMLNCTLSQLSNTAVPFNLLRKLGDKMNKMFILLSTKDFFLPLENQKQIRYSCSDSKPSKNIERVFMTDRLNLNFIENIDECIVVSETVEKILNPDACNSETAVARKVDSSFPSIIWRRVTNAATYWLGDVTQSKLQ